MLAATSLDVASKANVTEARIACGYAVRLSGAERIGNLSTSLTGIRENFPAFISTLAAHHAFCS